MKKITYTLCNPTGNRTVLVESPVVAKNRLSVAERLLAAVPAAEQVGFVRETVLDMAGGEFCGNATLSAAALYCERNRLPAAKLSITACGREYPVEMRGGCGSYAGKIALQMPKKISASALRFGQREYCLPCVEMDGISHLIVCQSLERAVAEGAVRQWCAEMSAPALGLMMLSQKDCRLTPLVFVPGSDTLYWENSCASGSAAVGAYLHSIGAGKEFSLQQPGGVLQVCIGCDIILNGTVILEKTVTDFPIEEEL